MEARTSIEFPEPLAHVGAAARALSLRELGERVVAKFREHRLVIQASAIAFRLLLASIPLLMFAFGVLGVLGLGSIWTDHVAPTLQGSVSGPAFRLIDESVTQVLRDNQVFWITIGLGI